VRWVPVLVVAAGCGEILEYGAGVDAGTAARDAGFDSATSFDASTIADSSLPVDAAPDTFVPPEAGPRCKVFATPATAFGSSGGWGNALVPDTVCRNMAANAALSGTFKAWISTADASPATSFGRCSGGYELPGGGGVVAESFADLTDGTLRLPINRNAVGAVLNGIVWTGTKANGTASGLDCQGWTSAGSGTFGRTTEIGSAWTAAGSGTCSETGAGVYCFEQP
jgi:hypothetical protein